MDCKRSLEVLGPAWGRRGLDYLVYRAGDTEVARFPNV